MSAWLLLAELVDCHKLRAEGLEGSDRLIFAREVEPAAYGTQPPPALLAVFALHDLQDDPVDNQVVGVGLEPENGAGTKVDPRFGCLGQNLDRLGKPIPGVPIRRADIDLLPGPLIRQFHQHLGLGDVPIVKFIILGGVSAGKGIEVDVLERVGNADQDRANEQLEGNSRNDDDPDFNPGALHQEADRCDGEDEHRTVEKIEMPPAVIKDRPPDDREEQEGPDEEDANEEIWGLPGGCFPDHTAEKIRKRGDVPEQSEDQDEDGGGNGDHGGDVAGRHRTAHPALEIDHPRPGGKVGRATDDVGDVFERLAPGGRSDQPGDQQERDDGSDPDPQAFAIPLLFDGQGDNVEQSEQRKHEESRDAHVGGDGSDEGKNEGR